MEKDGTFDPQGSREPRRDTLLWVLNWLLFDPQGSREPRHLLRHKAPETVTSIHKALASLDGAETVPLAYASDFDPQGSREPRRAMYTTLSMLFRLRSTRLSRASTDGILVSSRPIVFDPQGSREPRPQMRRLSWGLKIFDPQGSREPRQIGIWDKDGIRILRSTRLSRASTAKMHNYSCIYATFTCFILYIFYKSFIKLKFPRVI